MADIAITGMHHLRLTVTDIDRSRKFYEEVLGFEPVTISTGKPNDPDDPDQLFGGVVYSTPAGVISLRPVPDASEEFSPEHLGLEHLSFEVASRADLESALERLEARGVPHGEIRELPLFDIAILSFSDPDGLYLELATAL